MKFLAKLTQRILGIELKGKLFVGGEGSRHKTAANVQRPTSNVQRSIQSKQGGSAAPQFTRRGGGDAEQFSAAPTLLTSSAARSIHPPDDLGPITLAEKLGATLLMLATLAVGLYPAVLLDRIVPAVEAMRFLK
jgi:hypothetical protein